MKPLLFICFCLLFSCSSGNSQTISLKDFSETPTPAMYSKEVMQLNNTMLDFAVSLVNGELQILHSQQRGTGFNYNLPQGLLKGIDHGEFGGALYFLPVDTNQNFNVNGKPTDKTDAFKLYAFGKANIKTDKDIRNLILLRGGNQSFIFKYKDSLYIAESLAHMSLRTGELYTVDLKGNNFTIQQVIDFKDAPEAITVFNDKMLVACSSSFFVLDSNNKTKTFDHLFWDLLFPNSIVARSEREVYVGIRGGYVKLNLESRQVTFYKYNK